MSFYSILLFRGAFNEAVSKARLPHVERDIVRADFAEYITIENIFNSKILSTVYVGYDSKFYVDSIGYAEIEQAVFEKYGIRLEPVYKSVDIECFGITNYESFKDVTRQMKEQFRSEEGKIKREAFYLAQKEIDLNKKKVNQHLSKRLPDSLMNAHLLALDFEYDQNKNHLVFECGITTSFNDEVIHAHYLVDGNYQNKKNYELQLQFEFGESQVVTMPELMLILKDHLSKADYLVGHCLLSEYLVLEYHGLDIFEFEQLKCLDTQKIFQSKFKSNLKHSNVSLLNLLALFNVTAENLHNAGNDAAYTMLALITMANAFYLEMERNPERRRRIVLTTTIEKIKETKKNEYEQTV